MANVADDVTVFMESVADDLLVIMESIRMADDLMVTNTRGLRSYGRVRGFHGSLVVRKTPRSCILERYRMTYRSEGID